MINGKWLINDKREANMDKRITRVNLLWEESKDFKKGEERNLGRNFEYQARLEI